MKVQDIQRQEVEYLRTDRSKAAELQSEVKSSQKSHSSKMDIIELSPESRVMQKAGQIITNTPEIRSEKVQQLSEAIQQNTYQIDNRQVANSVIASIIVER